MWGFRKLVSKIQKRSPEFAPFFGPLCVAAQTLRIKLEYFKFSNLNFHPTVFFCSFFFTIFKERTKNPPCVWHFVESLNLSIPSRVPHGHNLAHISISMTVQSSGALSLWPLFVQVLAH